MIEWSQETITAFQKTLLNWYDQHKRDLPWRKDHDPYHVWVSEIMLQQNQVQTVIPYYLRFMKEFPTVQALADADEAHLMKAWEGLGYYSRARNLQKAARQIVTDYHGQWPTTVKGLQELSGVGPYTAGAIASIAFNQPVAAIDGNAFRVFSRLLEIDDDVAKPQTRKVFENVVDQIISKDRPGDFNQAIMDLGTSYMSAANYDSSHSPVKEFNQAYLDGIEDQFPVKTKKKRPVRHDFFALVLHADNQILFDKRPSTGILANFLMFPMFDQHDLIKDKSDSQEVLIHRVEEQMSTEDRLPVHLHQLPAKPVIHTFTHQQWHITLLRGSLPADSDLSYFPGKWIQIDHFNDIAFPKVQLKMWQAYQKAIAKK